MRIEYVALNDQSNTPKPMSAAKTMLAAVLMLMLPNLALTQDQSASSNDVDPHDLSVCSPDGVALGGYDVVAYHTQGQAVSGVATISLEHAGLSYWFSNEVHKMLFEETPEKYLPHFQGWCAIALARNRLTCPDYENFKIEDGKLLLFETIAFINGRTVWDSNPVKNLIDAEQNFARLIER